MNENRFGTLCAALVALGWGVAVAVNLFVWTPQLAAAGFNPLFYEDGRAFLAFVSANRASWGVFHVGANVALAALIPLITLLCITRRTDILHDTMRILGQLGAFSALIASLFDQLATPVLARWATGNNTAALTMWEAIEPFRDGGLKTIAFFFLGLWAIWVSTAWRQDGGIWLGRLTLVMGWGLVLVAAADSLLPLPWRNIIGETGVLGLVLLLIVPWALLVGRWFWQRELDIWEG